MPDGDPFVTGNDNYSVVVVGNLNPAIHHPAWYKLIGAFTDAEFDETGLAAQAPDAAALIGPGVRQLPNTTTLTTPALAQLRAGKLLITCTLQNYTIATYDRAAIPRIVEIASLVFQVLTHTPVGAYGFNFNLHRKTGVGDVGARIAQQLGSAGFDFVQGKPGARSAKTSFTLSEETRGLNVAIEQSVRAADMVFIAINAHHAIVPQGGVHLFDLAPLLKGGIERASSEADEVVSRIMVMFKGNG